MSATPSAQETPEGIRSLAWRESRFARCIILVALLLCPAAVLAEEIAVGPPSVGTASTAVLSGGPSASRTASVGWMHHCCNTTVIAAPSSPTTNMHLSNLGIPSLLNGPLNA